MTRDMAEDQQLETTSAQQRPEKATERPHPLTPLIRGWIVLVAIIIGFGRELIPGERGEGGIQELMRFGVRWVLLGIVAIVLLAALAGFLTWYFTRFVIDDEELRVETGWLAKRSRRIAFERIQSVDIIQPFAARIFGLVELRIEAGAGDSRTSLRYLTRSKATRIRDYLLARAHGEQVTVAGSAELPQASAFTDLSSADRKLVTINPGLLIMGLVLSSEFLISVGVVIVAVVVSALAGVAIVGLAGLVPMIFAVISLVSRRVIAQFNYTLAESERGLRITRGLTNLTSQSLPLNRIQGLRISQPLLWRRFGWSRVDIDVLGYGATESSTENGTDVSSILLPIADQDQVRLALSRVLPGAEIDKIELHPSPRRARAIRWLDGWTLRYGWDAAVVVSRHGVLTRTTDIVPHAKTQSVRITQGPLQRALRLASVHVDNTKGPVNLVANHLDPAVARDLALTQLDRARAARKAALPGSGSVADEPVLRRFQITGVAPLGSGGESVVYPLGDDHVLRIYRGSHEAGARMIEQLQPAYRSFSQVDLGFRTPVIVESGEVSGRNYSVDRRMPGMSFSAWLPTADAEQRRSALADYLRVAAELRRLPLPGNDFARLFGSDRRSFATLGELLEDQLRNAVRQVREDLDRDLPSDAVEQLISELHRRQCEPALVHGDYYPGNVFIDEIGGRMSITGVGDFSPHTLAADPLMDIAGAVELMGLEAYPEVAEDQAWLRELAIERHRAQEPDIEYWLDVYRRYYAVYYAPDPVVFPHSLVHLRSSPAI
jgi:putative membrane protein